MIVYQVKDLAAKTCGQPLMAESFDQAKLAVGRLISENPGLQKRASKILVEEIGTWNGEDGFVHFEMFCFDCSSGTTCLDAWNDAVADAREKDERGEPFFSDKLEEVSDGE